MGVQCHPLTQWSRIAPRRPAVISFQKTEIVYWVKNANHMLFWVISQVPLLEF